MIRSGVLASLVGLLFFVGGCADVLPAEPGTQAQKAPADRALDQFDLEGTIRSVDRAGACEMGWGGGSGSDDRLHRGVFLTCPLIPGDRNVYFDLVDALKRDVSAIATIGGGTSDLGDLTEPKSTVLDIRGSAYRGTLSILGTDGAGVFTIFVNLDLAIP